MATDDFPVGLNWFDFGLSLLSFIITALNLMALYADFVTTVRRAPVEIRDCLGTLRQQICEEREALKHQTRAHRQHERTIRADPEAPVLPLTYSDQTLSLHYVTLHDLWRQFQILERPFLASPEMRAENATSVLPWGVSDLSEKARQGMAVRESTTSSSEKSAGGTGVSLGTKDVSIPATAAAIIQHREADGATSFNSGLDADEDAKITASTANSVEDWRCLYACDFARRFRWWQTKEEVQRLGDLVLRVMLRRMEREVTQSRLMTMQLRGMRVFADEKKDGRAGYTVEDGRGETTSRRAS
jgi:hypothetical protein